MGEFWDSFSAGMAGRESSHEKSQREKIVCPHCTTAGHVTTKMVKRKKGISGGKATGAVLTGGISLLATGLARKGMVTELRCSNCGMQWVVAP